ncbi:MAG TPA: GntG family PLP-dependent aldolase [Mycobacteriales bacterium]|nr:GntG family PLP-dependent aldolase [Mycobacteriales bacterium]
MAERFMPSTGADGTNVDLRSDTLTRPTGGMRQAMAAAEVGDDVYGEDPTVNALQEQVAELFGHQAALLVPSGTMGNQLGVRLLVPPGRELICDAGAHVVTYEAGAAAVHGGISTRTWSSTRGRLDADAVEAMIRPDGFHTVPTAALAVEQTHNRGGGTVQPLDVLRDIRRIADEHGVAVHCDGARIWNAAVASGLPLHTYGRLFDTVSVCLSKGLGAPVGSLLVSTRERVDRARELRQRLGGGMRQAGVLAAAGRYALDHQMDRLADDHRRARRLAELVGVDPAEVDTNLVLVPAPDAVALTERARAEGVLVSLMGPRQVRLVTHLDIDDDGVERAGAVLAKLLTQH